MEIKVDRIPALNDTIEIHVHELDGPKVCVATVQFVYEPDNPKSPIDVVYDSGTERHSRRYLVYSADPKEGTDGAWCWPGEWDQNESGASGAGIH
jgi:hypothetical protein